MRFLSARRLLAGVSLLALAAMTAPAQAQQAPVGVAPPPPGETSLVVDASEPAAAAPGNQVYDQSFFAQYNLTNAEDMLRRIPGVSAILDATGTLNQARGLGAAGDQIMIGGKRMASKSTDVAATLRRIPASTVQRVELLRGTTGGARALSEGLVVNIILKAGAGTGAGQGNYEFNQRFNNMGWRDVDGLISWSNSLGRLKYTLGAEKNLFTPIGNTPTTGQMGDFTNRTRQEIYYYPNGVIQQLRPQDWERQHHKYIFTAQGVYDFENGDVLNLNLLFQPHNVKTTDITPYTSYSTAGVALPGITTEFHRNLAVRKTQEVGTEFEKKIGDGTFNVIAIHNRLNVKTRDYRNRTSPILSNGTGGVLTEVSKNTNKQITSEDVLRGSYSWPVLPGQTLTLGAEGANNALDQDQFIYSDLNRDGRQDFVVLTVAQVEEKRGELFAIHNWKISPKLSLETALSYEASQISTNYPQIPQTNYSFLKPRFDLRYNLTASDRLRFKIERTVSQLNFTNFVPIYNIIDSRLDPGNPAIAPEQTWIYETAVEHRLAKDQGTLEARAFYKDVTDHIDRGPFGGASGGLPSSAPINIDKAKAYGLELKAGVRLALIGLPNAQINARYQVQDSSVIDPFTGKERMIFNLYRQEMSLGFRHDLKDWRASYGGAYLATDGALLTNDIRNVQYIKRDPRMTLFVEKALPGNLTLRGEIYNLTGSPESSYRALYAVQQGGAVTRTETWKEERDIRYVIRLRGKF
jgi:hypothetical protein